MPSNTSEPTLEHQILSAVTKSLYSLGAGALATGFVLGIGKTSANTLLFSGFTMANGGLGCCIASSCLCSSGATLVALNSNTNRTEGAPRPQVMEP